MRAMPTARALLLLSSLLLPGCAYLHQVGNDAGEMLQLGLGASLVPGLYVQAQMPLFATSVGWLRGSTYVGSDFGYRGIWRQASAGIVLGGELVRTGPDAPLERFWTGHLADAYLDQSHYFVLGLVATDKRTRFAERQLGLTKVAVNAHVLFFGVTAGVDVLEVLDFVTALVGLDLLGDAPGDATPPEDVTPPEDGAAAPES